MNISPEVAFLEEKLLTKLVLGIILLSSKGLFKLEQVVQMMFCNFISNSTNIQAFCLTSKFQLFLLKTFFFLLIY